MNECCHDYIKQAIEQGNVFLGIELGSTRIKAVLIDQQYNPIASGGCEWENRLEDGIWTYPLDDVWAGLQTSFKELSDEVFENYGTRLRSVKAMGISAMMHGYLAFDCDGNLLVPFRTWRNTTTERAAVALTELFDFNIPQRWSIAHLYQAILDGENHVPNVAFLTTLAGYVHWRLTGEKVLGVGDASGVFPIDSKNSYDIAMLEKFNGLDHGLSYGLENILPRVLNAGDDAGVLTAEGALLLDPSGTLESGIPLCPPEGDAGTGMVATNSIAERTGNISAGTSIFAMVVLEKPLSKVYTEIDMVTTPSGKPVAMVHCNSCTSDLDAWVGLFGETAALFGAKPDKAELYAALYNTALEAESCGGGLLAYNYYAGEPITGLEQGRPLFLRTPDSKLTLANFMRTLLFSSLGTLKLGMNILTDEHVRLEYMLGHGGFFKTKGVGQKIMAAALDVPIDVMDSAGEGGAWGIALLAAYSQQNDESLADFLAKRVFVNNNSIRELPCPADVEGFSKFMQRYVRGLEVERTAVEKL